MVVPLKLTQFYGHSVPRPRIYADVKFSAHRVDPPASVNEALLSWASDALWSMGGLSFRRLRAQGKVEGSVRRLRAFLEEDDDAAECADDAEGVKPWKEASKRSGSADLVKTLTRKEVSKPAEKKRGRDEVESVEATPSKKLKRKDSVIKGNDEGSPVFVPATEEKLQKKGKVRSTPADVKGASNLRRKGLRSPAQQDAPVEVVLATGERARAKLFSASVEGLYGSKSPIPAESPFSDGSPTGKSGRLTRSAMKTHSGGAASAVQHPPRSRKILMRESLASDGGNSSDSDDGLEAFLKQEGRSLRRSSRRLAKESGNPLHSTYFAGSDSESE